MEITVDASDLRKLARYYADMPRVTARSAATALNEVGAAILESTLRAIAERNAQDPNELRQRVIVKEADPENLVWDMDASLIVAPSVDWNRPWETRGQDACEGDTLVNIITSEDECTCQVCQDYAADNPHTLDDVLQHQAQWADYVPPTPNKCPGTITNLMHPRCRCVAQPWSNYNRSNRTAFPAAPAVTADRRISMRQFDRVFQREFLAGLRNARPS